MEDTAREEYIQVGYTALRHPVTHEFLPAVPLFILADDFARAEESKIISDIGALLAQRMRAYKEGCQEAGVSI